MFSKLRSEFEYSQWFKFAFLRMFHGRKTYSCESIHFFHSGDTSLAIFVRYVAQERSVVDTWKRKDEHGCKLKHFDFSETERPGVLWSEFVRMWKWRTAKPKWLGKIIVESKFLSQMISPRALLRFYASRRGAKAQRCQSTAVSEHLSTIVLILVITDIEERRAHKVGCLQSTRHKSERGKKLKIKEALKLRSTEVTGPWTAKAEQYWSLETLYYQFVIVQECWRAELLENRKTLEHKCANVLECASTGKTYFLMRFFKIFSRKIASAPVCNSARAQGREKVIILNSDRSNFRKYGSTWCENFLEVCTDYMDKKQSTVVPNVSAVSAAQIAWIRATILMLTLPLKKATATIWSETATKRAELYRLLERHSTKSIIQ